MSATTSLVTGVDFIAVPTQDFEKADAFYGDVLGLERSKRWGNMPAGEFENGTVTIAVMQSDAFGIEFKPHSHPIAFQVDDVAAARAELEDKGIDVRPRQHRQRGLPHGLLPRPRRQRADAPPPLRAEGRGAQLEHERRPVAPQPAGVLAPVRDA